MALAIRPGRARLGAAGLAAALAAAGLLTLGAGHARAATTTLCGEQTAPVGGSYIVQNNEYDSSASECVSTDGNADFTVANSAISNATNGSPGAYPSIYQGCHWGNCSAGGLSSAPIQVSALTAGKVTTSWSTTQTGSGAYDVAYDIWYNQTPTTTGQPDGTEMMVWLNHNGSVQPFGSEVASNVSIGGHSYDIWYGTQSVWDTVTYEMTSGTTSVSGLDIGTLTQDMVSRGYTKSSWYLIDVEAGFELWQGGAGPGHQLVRGEHRRRRQLIPDTDQPGLTQPVPDADPVPVGQQHRAGRVLGGLLGRQQLAGRVPGPGRGAQHRLGGTGRLEPGLDLPGRSADHQPVERQLYTDGGHGGGDQRLLRQQHPGRRHGHGRLHRQLHREQQRARERLVHLTPRAARPAPAAPEPARRAGWVSLVRPNPSVSVLSRA